LLGFHLLPQRDTGASTPAKAVRGIVKAKTDVKAIAADATAGLVRALASR
jgi:hypothetical protein